MSPDPSKESPEFNRVRTALHESARIGEEAFAGNGTKLAIESTSGLNFEFKITDRRDRDEITLPGLIQELGITDGLENFDVGGASRQLTGSGHEKLARRSAGAVASSDEIERKVLRQVNEVVRAHCASQKFGVALVAIDNLMAALPDELQSDVKISMKIVDEEYSSMSISELREALYKNYKDALLYGFNLRTGLPQEALRLSLEPEALAAYIASPKIIEVEIGKFPVGPEPGSEERLPVIGYHLFLPGYLHLPAPQQLPTFIKNPRSRDVLNFPKGFIDREEAEKELVRGFPALKGKEDASDSPEEESQVEKVSYLAGSEKFLSDARSLRLDEGREMLKLALAELPESPTKIEEEFVAHLETLLNEEGSIVDLVKKLGKEADKAKDKRISWPIVSDASPERTSDILNLVSAHVTLENIQRILEGGAFTSPGDWFAGRLGKITRLAEQRIQKLSESDPTTRPLLLGADNLYTSISGVMVDALVKPAVPSEDRPAIVEIATEEPEPIVEEVAPQEIEIEPAPHHEHVVPVDRDPMGEPEVEVPVLVGAELEVAGESKAATAEEVELSSSSISTISADSISRADIMSLIDADPFLVATNWLAENEKLLPGSSDTESAPSTKLLNDYVDAIELYLLDPNFASEFLAETKALEVTGSKKEILAHLTGFSTAETSNYLVRWGLTRFIAGEFDGELKEVAGEQLKGFFSHNSAVRKIIGGEARKMAERLVTSDEEDAVILKPELFENLSKALDLINKAASEALRIKRELQDRHIT